MTPVYLKLKTLREEARLTQAELADAVDVRQPTISALETGTSRRIEFDLLDRLCAVLGKRLERAVTPGDLFFRGPPALAKSPAKGRRGR